MIPYLIKSALCMAIVLGFYHVLLSKQKMPKFNRFYLLFGLIFSIVAPLITIRTVVIETISAVIPVNAVNNLTLDSSITSSNYTISIIIGIYAIISVLFLSRFIFNLLKITRTIVTSESRRKQGTKLILLNQDIVPHSFLNHIFLNKEKYLTGKIDKMILRHELSHVKQYHTIDILILEVLHVILWFNPLLFLFQRAIRLNHEILADESAVDNSNEIHQYQELLLGTIGSNKSLRLSSNLNYLLTKKRLTMMTKKQNPVMAFLSGVISIPLFVGLLLVAGQTAYTQEKITDDQENSTSTSWAVTKAKIAIHFQNATFLITNDKNQVLKKSFGELTTEERAMIPPPPPPPADGRSTSVWISKVLQPLPEGTIINLNDHGKIRLGGNGLPVPPPPPPPAPAAPKASLSAPPPPPPAPPMADAPPPPPSPPIAPSILDRIDYVNESGGKIMMEGKEITAKKAKSILAKNKEGMCISVTEEIGKKPMATLKKN